MHILRLFLLINCFFLIACGSESTTTKTPKASANPTAATAETKEVKQKKKNIIFFGDSLTAAYGLDPSEGFPALIQDKINQQNLNYKVVNAGLSGETTAGGVGRIDWILKQPVDIFILELGGNDGLRGIDTKTTYSNLSTIAQKVKTKYPKAKLVIAGMEAPPNLGNKFTSDFRAVFPKVAKENDAALIPFLLDKVGGIAELNQADRIHPTAEGHKIVAENVWTVLKDLL